MANQPLVHMSSRVGKEPAHSERVKEGVIETLRIGKMGLAVATGRFMDAVIHVPDLSKLHQESVRRFMCEERVDELWQLVGSYYGPFLGARPNVWDILSSTVSQFNAVKSFDPNPACWL